jgi:hypothetical protein
LAVAVIAQAVDTSAGWAPRKNQIVSQKSTYDGPLRSKDWASIVGPYQKIRRIPPGRVGHFPKEIAYFAARHKLPTDAVYLARIDHQRRDQLLKYSEYVLLSGNYELDALYFIDEKYAGIAGASLDRRRHLFAVIDGYHVIAPDWYAYAKATEPNVKGNAPSAEARTDVGR